MHNLTYKEALRQLEFERNPTRFEAILLKEIRELEKRVAELEEELRNFK